MKPQTTIDPCRLAGVQEVIEVTREVHGFDLSCFDESFFLQSLQKRLHATATATLEEYLDLLRQNPGEAKDLMASLGIVYSEFFRNPLAFALLEQTLLPAICEAKRQSGSEIRVWSAGCATGQEAWSAAILLDELAALGKRPVPYRIIATDRSESALARARTGRYHLEALGNVKTRHLRSAFSRQGDFFTVVPRLRRNVSFSVYDLLDTATLSPPESIYGNFDLVFCCNILLYYRPVFQTHLLQKIRRCLARSGYLITDETERRIVEEAGVHLTWVPPAAVFQKCEDPRQSLESEKIP